MKVPEKIPDWLAVLPGNALLTTRDMYKMFGYKSGDIMTVSIHNNRIGVQFPDPDYRGYLKFGSKVVQMERGRENSVIQRWKASTIRNFIRHVNRNSTK